MTIEAPLVFLDTETTGLDLTDDIWEFSAIRRDPNGIDLRHTATADALWAMRIWDRITSPKETR